MTKISDYFDIKRDAKGEKYMEVYLDGIVLLRLAMSNKGTAFTPDERIALKLDGLLPPQVSTLDQQVERAYRRFSAMTSDIAKYQYLRGLQDRHETLFYALLERNLREMLPIVYTPTVGEAVQNFHRLYQNARGFSVSPLNIDRAKSIVGNYPWHDVRMIVATDSSAILGIGDQGYGGLAISIGKLALYTAAGGVSPFHTMPVSLDVGTERKDLIEDSLYLGVRQKRLRGEEYIAFLDKFVEGVRSRWPTAVIQWEDLSKDTAFTVLERYRKTHPSFNDDIQGTGAVTLAGALVACRKMGKKFKDQRIIIHGAGAGGGGVAWALHQGMVREGLTPAEAYARIFVLDSKGLLTTDRDMEAYKRPFAQDRALLAGWPSVAAPAIPGLVETITQSKATMLIGLSGQPNAFDEEVVRAMGKVTDRPIIFPLSNPTSSCEGRPADILKWTDGRAVVATGSPFADVIHGDRTIRIGQGNNAFIFPGLGFGSILSNAREITDAMVLEAAYALADYTTAKYTGEDEIYPPVDDLREASVAVATRVIKRAIEDGVAQPSEGLKKDIEGTVRSRFWRPAYMPIVRG